MSKQMSSQIMLNVMYFLRSGIVARTKSIKLVEKGGVSLHQSLLAIFHGCWQGNSSFPMLHHFHPIKLSKSS